MICWDCIAARFRQAFLRCPGRHDFTQRARTPLASRLIARHLRGMKTATAQQVPQKWAQILQWVASGEEVEVTERDKVVARLLPPAAAPGPDFLARAKAVWGDDPAGEPLSAVVSQGRGGGL